MSAVEPNDAPASPVPVTGNAVMVLEPVPAEYVFGSGWVEDTGVFSSPGGHGVSVPGTVGVTVGVPGSGVGVWTTKLLARMKTLLSKRLSPRSAMANLIVFVWPGTTVASQVSTTVRPSISVLIEPPPSPKSLLR